MPTSSSAGGTANLFESIPDPVFKAYCEQFDTNHDGILTQEEAAAANEIIVPDMGIASLEGLDYFSGITRLVCNNNQLTTLCTAYNPLLVELVCNDNQLTELLLTKGISGGDELTTLSCQNNQLSKLSVAGCKKLTTVNCQNNLLTDLNTHWAYALSRVNCSNNKLTGLSFYQVDEIAILNCSNNELTSLSVAGKKLLTSLMCSDNPMTSLDISGCTSLVGVMAYANRLTELGCVRHGQSRDLQPLLRQPDLRRHDRTDPYAHPARRAESALECHHERLLDEHRRRPGRLTPQALRRSRPGMRGGFVFHAEKRLSSRAAARRCHFTRQAAGWSTEWGNFPHLCTGFPHSVLRTKSITRCKQAG